MDLESDIIAFYRGDIRLQFKKDEKNFRWGCGTKISKPMTSSLLSHPQGCHGHQKNLEDIFEDHFGELECYDSAQVEKNQTKKTRFLCEFLFNFDSFFNFG